MANSKLIIVEGAQGAGKTTVTDYIRHSLKYTNLYRLSGTSDKTIAGKEKAIKIYDALNVYMKSLENTSVNLLFDRTFFTEENYTRLGFKEYSFSDVYYDLVKKLNDMDFDIYYITLYLEDVSEYEKRILRKDKAIVDYAKFEAQSSINQQKVYLEMAEELKGLAPNIKVYNVETSGGIESVEKKIKEILQF
mgnify:CR=1 FL=1